jgi:hypothetical protein
MAQSALTVTPESPTPPTNISTIGLWPPNPLNWNTSVLGPPYVPTNAPYFDDGIAAATPNAGSSAAANGNTLNEPSGTRTAFIAAHALVNDSPGVTSVAHEGLGDNNAVVTAPGSRTECPTQSFSCGPAQTAGVLATPNASHASNLSGSTVPTITGNPAPNNSASGTGFVTMTLTGTGYTRASVVLIDGVPQTTQYVSATSLTVTNAPKRLTAGTRSVVVSNNGVVSAASTWTFT